MNGDWERIFFFWRRDNRNRMSLVRCDQNANCNQNQSVRKYIAKELIEIVSLSSNLCRMMLKGLSRKQVGFFFLLEVEVKLGKNGREGKKFFFWYILIRSDWNR